jgi:hypothetical protein
MRLRLYQNDVTPCGSGSAICGKKRISWEELKDEQDEKVMNVKKKLCSEQYL